MFGQCLGIDAVGHGCTVRDILMHLVTVFLSLEETLKVPNVGPLSVCL